jgi:hypothetical protein
VITLPDYLPPVQAAGSTASQPAGKIPSKAGQQLTFFKDAVRLFNAREFRGARNLFQEAAFGPKRDVAHRASQYVTMCERRLLPE